jgi:hypothetical protein
MDAEAIEVSSGGGFVVLGFDPAFCFLLSSASLMIAKGTLLTQSFDSSCLFGSLLSHWSSSGYELRCELGEEDSAVLSP